MSTLLRRFVNDLGRVVEQAKYEQAMSIARGAIPNMEQYHRQVGRLEGMDNTVKVARDMLGQMEAAADQEHLPEMPPGEAPPTNKRARK